MTDLHVSSANFLDDGSVVWLTDKHTWGDRLEHATCFEHTQIDGVTQAAPLPDQFVMLVERCFSSLLVSETIALERWHETAQAHSNVLTRPRTQLGRLSEKRQA